MAMAEQVAETTTEPVEDLIFPRIRDRDWIEKTECDPTNGNDLFPRTRAGTITLEEKDVISKHCAPCLVREECLINALRKDFREGVMGGMTESQREPVHERYAKSRTFEATDWRGYVNTALETKESFTVRQKQELANQREAEAKLLDSITEQPQGKVLGADTDDLVEKLASMTGVKIAKIVNYLGHLERAGKVEKLFVRTPDKRTRGRLVGVQLNVDAA